ncbi:hypothetical protein ACFXPS_39625, partial [Nocardia sp. NPDC059091]|uniref:hypothetical protein n=1 Tax=Nocardia sp. NPDC059091 TaxID=3346724 RepID=UPI0036989A04
MGDFRSECGLLRNGWVRVGRVSGWPSPVFGVSWPGVDLDAVVAKGYRRVERDQQFLMPPDMREWLPEGDPVWLVIEA